jgi:hypothetical protein
MLYRKRGRQPTDGGSKLVNSAFERGDELQGQRPRKQLVRMDADFCARMERAIQHGTETREAAGGRASAR